MNRTYVFLPLLAAMFFGGNVSAQTPVPPPGPPPAPSPVAPPAPPPAPVILTPLDTTVRGLSPGDEIRIAVYRNLELSGDFTVAANGTILHPLYREVQVTGIPMSAVEERIRVFLMKYVTNPQFIVQALVKVVVAGEVKAPNIYAVPPEATIAQVLMLAGGPTNLAQLDKILVVRRGGDLHIDMSKADANATRIRIASNDEILVPRGSSFFRDTFAPVISTVGAVAGIINLVYRISGR